MKTKDYKNIEKGKTYFYKRLEEYAKKENLSIDDVGPLLVGENFVVLKGNDNDFVISLVLTGASSLGCMYECIYNDTVV